MIEKRLTISVMAILLGICLGGCLEWERKPVVLMATTTSTDNTGLLDYLAPMFEKEYNCDWQWTAVGTEQALEIGIRGDADVLMVHAPEAEEEFMKNGYGDLRYKVAYNWFVLLGPENDPAGIIANNASDNATMAFHLIYNAGKNGLCRFVSRGDNSGTHKKEQEIWNLAGYNYSEIESEINKDWYISTGKGMGQSLQMASDMGAYVFTDEGTYFSYESKLDLKEVVRNDLKLLNQYSVIVVKNPRNGYSGYGLAVKFALWITSPEIQQKIAEYKINGRQLFYPNAG